MPQQMSPPGPQMLDELVGDAPAALMIDEAAHYLRAAKEKAGLVDQTVAFSHRLVEFAVSRDNVVAHRLFASVGSSTAKAVAKAYLDHFRKAAKQGVGMPAAATQAATQADRPPKAKFLH